MAHSKSAVAVILLTVFVAVESFLYVQLQDRNSELDSLYEEVEERLASLENRYFELQKQYDLLYDEYFSMEASHRNLTRDYSNLQDRYGSFVELVGLQGDYEREREYVVEKEAYIALLREACVRLQRGYEVETVLRIGNTLESFYDLVRHEKELIGYRWTDHQKDANFATDLALHDLGYNCWPSIENAYYSSTGIRSYEVAKRKMDQVVDLIGLQGHYTPTAKIKMILQFIVQNIHFEHEVHDIYLAPTETLGFRSGDCEDFSILASALFEAVGIESAFGIFKSEEDEYHGLVLVHLDDLTGYEYWSHSDLTDVGLDEGKWIVIEPQYTVDKQNSDWIGELSLVAVSPLD
jgi:hypothetical protein